MAARAGRGPARNGRARDARPNAGRGAARGGPTPRGIEGEAGGARGDGARVGQGRRRDGRARAARPNAGAGMARGGPTPRGIEADPADGRATRRGWPRGHPPHPPGDRGGGGGAAKLTRGPRSGDHKSVRGGRAPPTGLWGARPPREGRMPDNLDRMPVGADRPPAGRMTRAGRSGTMPARDTVAGRTAAGGLSPGPVAHFAMGLGVQARWALAFRRGQAPRRPHDAGWPTGAVAGTRGRRRPARGGRP